MVGCSCVLGMRLSLQSVINQAGLCHLAGRVMRLECRSAAVAAAETRLFCEAASGMRGLVFFASGFIRREEVSCKDREPCLILAQNAM